MQIKNNKNFIDPTRTLLYLKKKKKQIMTKNVNKFI